MTKQTETDISSLDRPALTIEVTSAMIKAGEDVMWQLGDVLPEDDLLKRVYTAMAQADEARVGLSL